MEEKQSITVRFMELDLPFLKSKRGLLKIAELVVLFMAFVSFAAAVRPAYISATCLEFFITLALLILYLLKLHKSLSFFFWPLIDVLNSCFAALFLCIISLVAVSTFTTTGTLVGGLMGFVAVALWCVDGFFIFRKITFNQTSCSAPH